MSLFAPELPGAQWSVPIENSQSHDSGMLLGLKCRMLPGRVCPVPD